ncbi:ABC-type transport auxiliary lipoprotein family protein [Undibacterium sp. Ji67W]|uniref:ABC-type transport auxiliary lipoprotein family protein n=1 Tax=Undibacterium sp. Ji67W TaxID=3413042 RepID=UPI003BF07430
MKIFDHKLPLSAVILALSGCGMLQPVSPPSMKEYRLEAVNAAKVITYPAPTVSIDISIIRAAPGLDTKRMLYVQHPYQIEYYQHSAWQQKPTSMLMPLVVTAIEASGLFHVVLQSPDPINATYHLALELTQFEQDFTVHPSVVHFGLRAYLAENKTHTVVAWTDFDVKQNLLTEDAYGGVVASKLATTEALQQLVQFCRLHIVQGNAAP